LATEPKNLQAVNLSLPVEPKISWLDRFSLWIDQRPWPAWLFYAALMVVIEILLNVTFWMDGSVPLWEHVTLPSFSPPLIALGFAFYHYLTKAGSKALQDFSPYLVVDDGELATIDKDLNYLPAWMGWLVIGLGILGSISYVFGSPNTYGTIVPQSALPPIILYILSVATVVPFFSLILRIIRQVRILQDLYKQATNINLLHLDPAHAFARLTAKIGGGLIILLLLGVIYNPEMITGVNLWGYVVGVGSAVLIFILPLSGLRSRLIQEKVQRLKDISVLLQSTIEHIHAQAKNQNYTDVSQAKTTLNALMDERALIEKVSTWPWDTGTLRGFASTLILPIVLWLITRLLERYL
jgi:hypothetical protein